MIHRVAPILLITSLALATPAAGQWIPDDIPDDPEESLADLTRKRMIERYSGVLGRFFTGGSVGMAPLNGPAYRFDAGLGLTLDSGDALLLSVGARTLPRDPDRAPDILGLDDAAWLVGVGYEVSGTRVFGASPLGWRTALGLGLAATGGSDFTAAMFEVAPLYDLVVRQDWSVPVGVRLSVAALDTRDPRPTVTRPSLGLQLGVRWHLVRRGRLDHRTDQKRAP